MNLAVIPTAHDEAWRYSDHEALATVWPISGPEHITVPAGETNARYLIQTAADDAVAIHDYAIHIEDDARLDFHILNMGGKFGRVSLDVTLGEGAHFELGGAILGNGTQTLEIVTTVNHAQPHATSRQTIRSVLSQKATGSFLGAIKVARHAQKTDAAQSVKAMILDRTATANAKPELEIFADDVKCAHGATVGELDKAALFYMESRGMEPGLAKRVMLRAFIAGVFDNMADEAVRAEMEQAALAKLEAMA
ncbi:MAG: SufD family Fe-S cluster assembly protein [Alphaproteobacteria bacterium]|nr:SufD family Fe-S cluster assembly protein [Alphaproteobacteria bacterium]